MMLTCIIAPTPAMRRLAEESCALERERAREAWERSQLGGLTLDEANAEASERAGKIDWDGLRDLFRSIGG
jgi:hypothetical protein